MAQLTYILDLGSLHVGSFCGLFRLNFVVPRLHLGEPDFSNPNGYWDMSVSRGTLAWANARSRSKISEITLMRSLKSAWNLTNVLDGQDILSVSCRPDDDTGRFSTTYSRYHYNGTQWLVSSRRERHFWEADDGDQQLGITLPETTKFP
jgi:hypothetical protein